MHDIDRTQLEGWGMNPYGSQESGYGNIYDETFDDESEGYEGDFGYESEGYGGDFGYESEGYGGDFGYEEEVSLPFNDATELALAAELLDITNEQELDQFLGKLFRNVTRTVGKAIPRSVRRSLGRTLKGLARQALPIAGAALGNLVAPGIGGAIGSNLASTAGSMFGLEVEGLSPEDQSFEVARRYVRLAGDAVRQAATAPPQAPPQAVAQRAVVVAAQKHAPGLVGQMGGSRGGQMMRRGRAQRGIWQRRGNAIVLMGFFRS